MDDMSWGALALALSAIAGIWTWYAFRNRGIASGVRGVGFTMLPIAAWMTNTLELAGDVAGAVTDWAVHLVFSPSVWVGIVLAGVAALLLMVSVKLPGGSEPAVEESRSTKGEKNQQKQAQRSRTKAVPKSSRKNDGGLSETLGDDADDIEAILRKHGIS